MPVKHTYALGHDIRLFLEEGRSLSHLRLSNEQGNEKQTSYGTSSEVTILDGCLNARGSRQTAWSGSPKKNPCVERGAEEAADLTSILIRSASGISALLTGSSLATSLSRSKISKVSPFCN
jgi:hypothetical protein